MGGEQQTDGGIGGGTNAPPEAGSSAKEWYDYLDELPAEHPHVIPVKAALYDVVVSILSDLPSDWTEFIDTFEVSVDLGER